jgi:hypothetical protein
LDSFLSQGTNDIDFVEFWIVILLSRGTWPSKRYAHNSSKCNKTFYRSKCLQYVGDLYKSFALFIKFQSLALLRLQKTGREWVACWLAGLLADLAASQTEDAAAFQQELTNQMVLSTPPCACHSVQKLLRRLPSIPMAI